MILTVLFMNSKSISVLEIWFGKIQGIKNNESSLKESKNIFTY